MIEIFDDIIPKYYQDYIEDLIIGKHSPLLYPLYFINNLSTGDAHSQNEFGFGSTFFQDGKLNNHYPHSISLLHPLFSLIEKHQLILTKIIQARVYLTPPTTTSIPLESHIDQTYPHYALLYYVNNTDGDTCFYKGKEIIKKVSPKKGRVVLFNGNIEHGASTSTVDKRIIINYNFNIMDPKKY